MHKTRACLGRENTFPLMWCPVYQQVNNLTYNVIFKGSAFTIIKTKYSFLSHNCFLKSNVDKWKKRKLRLNLKEDFSTLGLSYQVSCDNFVFVCVKSVTAHFGLLIHTCNIKMKLFETFSFCIVLQNLSAISKTLNAISNQN